MPGPASRVVYLGLDGATEAVLRPAFERGWMPNLQALWRRSATGTLWSSEPMVTPVAWTSFLTGCHPPTHGIHEFHYLDPVDRTILPNHAGRIRVPTLWDTLSERGHEIVSLGLPMTYPPPDIRGLVVAGSDAPGLKWAFAQCPDFGEEILRELPGYSHKVLWKRRPRSLEELRAVSRRNQEVFRAQADAAERADARCDWTAMMVHFHNLDGIQHRLWPYLDLDETAEHQPEWSVEVVNCLRELDRAVGRLLELASRRNAAVIALSDHGFGPCRALVDVNGLLCQAGLQRRLPYGTRISYRLRRLRDRFDRWKRRRTPDGTARRGPRSIEGEVGCDWSKTVAFAPFGQLCGSIFLNPNLVSGSSAASRIIAEIIDACRAVEDPDTGQPLFADAFDVAERYNLDPAAEGLPDVLAPSTDGYQAMAKWDPFCRSLLRPDPNLPATHRTDGVIAIEAPGILPGSRLDAELPDVAPTSLSMLGLAIPEVMEGRVLEETQDLSRVQTTAGTSTPHRPTMD